MLEVFENVLAEQAVIGGILLKPSKAADMCEMLTANDFTRVQHQILFSAIENLTEQDIKCDVVTVQGVLSEKGQLSQIGGLPYLIELNDNTPSSANINAYAEQVKDASDALQADQMIMQARACLYDDGALRDRINNTYSQLAEIGTSNTEKHERDWVEICKATVKQFEKQMDNKTGIVGESTGFKALDERTYGLQKTDLIIVAGRPSMGKTAFSMNIARNIAENKPVVVFSMEMSAEQLTTRLWSTYGVPLGYLKQGKMGEYDTQLNPAMMKTMALKLTIDDRSGLTPQQVRAKAIREKRKHGELGAVVVDYLQLMQTNGKSDNRTHEITKISGALKGLAKELDCPVIALSQLNRGVENRGNKRPNMADLRESGSIEQDANVIMMLYRDDYYAEKEGRPSDAENKLEVITVKNRDGECGTDFLECELMYQRFADSNWRPVERKHDEVMF